jgi:hypothetical protein
MDYRLNYCCSFVLPFLETCLIGLESQGKKRADSQPIMDEEKEDGK